MASNADHSLTKSNGSFLDKFRNVFTKFVTYSLIVLFIILIFTSVGVAIQYKDFNSVNLTILGVYILLTAAFLYGIHKKIKKRTLLISILLIGFLLRLTWAFMTPSVPVSDFENMYTTAQNILNGDYSNLHGLGYFARFPHMLPFSLFEAFILKYFGDNSLLVLKSINVALSTLSILLVYLICNSVFKDYKRSLCGAFFMALLPSSILYTAVYCSENVAIPFYLASIYLFILVLNNKKNSLLLILSGAMLSVGHIFRMIAYIVLIAYVMYIIIYDIAKLRTKIRNIIFIIVPFAAVLMLVSNTLVNRGITDRQLWNGSEPNITSAVRGSNIETTGSWNPEDAEFIAERLDDRDALEKDCLDRIITRYTTTPPAELGKFFIKKFTTQWAYGDCAGAYWSELELDDSDIKFDVSGKGIASYQLIFSVLLLLTLKGLFNGKEHTNNKIVNLFYIILCGFGAAYLLLENQCRYAFIISFIFSIMPVVGLSASHKK